ncbi:MAG: hypothetical protein VKN56_08555 [Cyanobacteriota bacterium]|nr:hypothetical protein [Cyanobacteriota bacterium]
MFTSTAFDLLSNWFEHPLVNEQKADPGLLAAALECWYKHAEILPDAPNDLPTAKHFRYGQKSMLENAKYIASQIRRDPEPYPAPQNPEIEANVQVEESNTASTDHWAA